MKRIYIVIVLVVTFVACKNQTKTEEKNEVKEVIVKDSLIYPEETHFKSMRQVTFGGDNAEAYWSFDDKQLVF